MGMYDSADVGERVVENHMCSRIRRRIVFALNFVSLKVDNHHIFRFQTVILHSAGFDHKETFLSVNAAYISPGKCYKPVLRQIHIGFINFFF